MGEEKKRVTLDKKKIGMRFVEKTEVEIEVPEMNAMMGLDDGDIAVVKIRQLDLSEYISCQQGIEDKMRNLIEGVIAAAEKQGEVEDEIAAAYKGLSPMAKYHVNICVLGVVDPKLTKKDWTFLANNFPMMVERITNSILMLTQGGSSLKKNS